MPIAWSEPRPPTKDVCHYDHVVAQTPLGELRIEWKGWKSPGEAYTCDVPWSVDAFVVANDLDDAKQQVQAAWNKMAALVAELST